jgi:hypothetical protein
MAPFLCLYFVQLAHHVLWRDEFNAWAIVCVSQTLPELLHRVRYEAHPALWYLLLYGPSRITHAPWMLKLVQGVIGTAIYLLLALTTPFRRLELVLIFLGYYISFEYTVMCRMYGLEVVFALVYVYLRMRHPERLTRNMIWLGLMANVDATGGILSLGLLLEYLWDRYRHYRAHGNPAPSQFAAAVATYAAFVAVSVATLWPARDIGWAATGRMFSEFGSAEHLGSSFAKWGGMAFFPQTMDPILLWYDPQPWPHGAIVPVVLLLFYGVFRKHRRLGVMLAGIALMGLLFSHATSVSGVRHIGIEYIAFLIALWMMRFRGEKVSNLAYVILGLLVVANIYNVARQWNRPFCDDDDAAQWIRQNHLENDLIMGTPDTNIIGVPERLDRPVYELECGCFDRVLTFSKRRDGFNPRTDVPAGMVRGMQTLHAPSALFLLNRPLYGDEIEKLSAAHITATLLAKFDRGYVADENFFIYRLRAPAAQ